MKKKKILTEVFVLFFIAALFIAVYVVIEMGNDWLAVLGGAAVLLIASYLLMDYGFEAFFDHKSAAKEEGNAVTEHRLDEIEEVQKAVYTVIKRGNAENAELLQKIEARLSEVAQVLERVGDAAVSGNAELGQARYEIQQLGSDTLDAVKGLRQDYQTGVKNLIKYEKENAKQIAETTHTNTEMTIMEIGTQLAKIQECLQAQREELASLHLSAINLPTSLSEEVSAAKESADAPEMEDLLPVLDDAKQVEIPVKTMENEEVAETDTDDFDAEAAIKAYMIEQGYVDVEATENPEETAAPIMEPVIEEPMPVVEESTQKSEEEIASTLQGMASGDPNRALTPEEIAAMFAAIQ